MKKSFYSSRNIVLSIIINVSILGTVFLACFLLKLGGDLKDGRDWFAIAISILLILSAVYIEWTWYSPLVYVIEDDKFYYIYGRKKSKIYSIHDITKAIKSRTLQKSPARGIKRIEIMCHGDYIIISPKNRDLFISALKEVNPNILVTDEY